MADEEEGLARGYALRQASAEERPPSSGDFDNEDEGYEQWEEGLTEGDQGNIEETYLLDPDSGFSEEDLLFAENAFSPHMTGSPIPKDGLEVPDVPGAELETDDATTDPWEAIDDGKIYYPPEDPPVVPSLQLRDVDIASGFATSADDAPLDEYDDPERFDVGDLQIASNVREALRLHSSTSDLDIAVQVRDGVVVLRGRVNSWDDIDRVEDIASEVEGVEEVREQLTLD